MSAKMTKEHKDQLIEIEKGLLNHLFPQQIVIETTSCCNFKCLHCSHKELKRKREHMAEALYKKIIDEIAREAPEAEVWPTFYGESFLLGKKLFTWLRYAEQKGLKNLVLNSNGSLLYKLGAIDEILTCGLKRLIFSLDGFSQKTFEKIRIGGKRDKIYAYVERLLVRRRELGLIYPVVICQFSVMEENQHEVNDFYKYWCERGAQVKIREKLSWTGSGSIVASNLDYNAEFRIACPWAVNTMAIHANGNAVACAVDYEGLFVGGNATYESLKEIWQGRLWSEHRKLHLEHEWEHIPQICKTCVDWQAVRAKYFSKSEEEKLAYTRPFWYNPSVARQ